MTDIATLGLKIDSSGVVKATGDLDKLATQGSKAENATSKLSKQSATASAAMGGFSKKAGQAGIQVQQLVGQVQGGVSPMVALSQQSADLGFVLGFPLLGAVAGITASIAGPLISALLGAESATDGVQKVMETAGEAADELGNDYDEVASKLGTLTEAEKTYIQLKTAARVADAKIAMQDLQKSITGATAAVNLFAKGGNASYQGFGNSLNEAELELAKLRAEQQAANVVLEESQKINDLVVEGKKSETEAAAKYITQLQNEVESLGASIERKAELIALSKNASEEQKLEIIELEKKKAAKEAEIEAEKKAANQYKSSQTELERQETAIKNSIERMKAQTVATNEGRAAAIRYAASIEASKISNKELAAELIQVAEAQAQAIEKQEQMQEVQKESAKETRELEKDHKKLTDSISKGLEDAILGYESLGDVAVSILEDIARAVIQQNITNPLVDSLSSSASSSGFFSGVGDFFSGLFSANASGGVVNTPTAIGMQGSKIGIGGEAGPEAILPLKRGSNGDLGVQVQGGSSSGSNVYVNINNQTGGETQVNETQGASGERIINVTVLKAVKDAIGSGSLDRDFRTNYGIQRKGT